MRYLIIFLLIVFIAPFIDLVYCYKIPWEGEIIGMTYSPSRDYASNGTAIAPNGSVSIVTQSFHESERYLFCVRTSNGSIITCDASPELYFSKKIKSKVSGVHIRGRFTKMYYWSHAKN